jgi:hypothetical protein
MRRWWCRRLGVPVVLGLLLATAACNKEKFIPPPATNVGDPMGGRPGMGGGRGGPKSPIGKVMDKVANGRQSLNMKIGQELNSGSPPWEEIQPQAKEYAELTATLGKYDPPRGDKDSWVKLTSAFAQSAEELNKAAAKKDKDAALAVHKTLSESCKTCHDAHRRGPGGGRGRGGFGPKGGPQGEPPPGN